MSNQNNRVDIYIHIDGGSGSGQGGDVLTVLKADVVPKLDWIISQGEQILAAGGSGNAQQTIDNLTAQVRQLTESQAQSQQELQKTIEENK